MKTERERVGAKRAGGRIEEQEADKGERSGEMAQVDVELEGAWMEWVVLAAERYGGLRRGVAMHAVSGAKRVLWPCTLARTSRRLLSPAREHVTSAHRDDRGSSGAGTS